MRFCEEMEELIKKTGVKLIQLDEDEIEEKNRLKYLLEGYKTALKIFESNLRDSLIVGEIYYVVNYKDGLTTMPVIEKMKLYKIAKRQYCFTYDLKKNGWILKENQNLRLGAKEVTKRVFANEAMARKAIGLKD